MNDEDNTVPQLVKKVIPQIETLVNKLVTKLKNNGWLIYIGAGTSGRLGILDASECPLTFGVSSDVIVGLFAGGDTALRQVVENAQDNKSTAWERDLSTAKNNCIGSSSSRVKITNSTANMST
ncbi:MAG: hypothetical protein LBF27_05260 [Sphingobacterium sp.]|jgi:N-acetylmuramic acid 6-phosphate etherase|nr:hypothetical protein [Sphingobacterium sp.]